jgi:diaminohydroxyphosphoribosylaminopyrimidine deaminase/5-amino-6-(5-phosphoribosylamino)uracil reductase
VPPVRVVLDSAARISPDAQLLRTAREAPTLVLTAPHAPAERTRALRQSGAEVLSVAAAESGLDPRAVLVALGERGVHSVLAEGGARLARALLGADLVERLYLFVAPRILGPGALRVFDAWREARASQWQVSSHRRHGADIQVVLERDRSRE